MSAVLTSEFQNKKVFKLIPIDRTHEAYIFTREKDFYIVNIRDMKIVYHTNLHITQEIKNIYCNELECTITTNNSLIKMEIFYKYNSTRGTTLQTLQLDPKQKDVNRSNFCKRYSTFYQKNEGYIINFYTKLSQGKCQVRAGFLNLYHIQELAVDSELFYTNYDFEKNALFFNTKGELKKAKTNQAFSFLVTLHELSWFVVYLPLFPFLGRQ